MRCDSCKKEVSYIVLLHESEMPNKNIKFVCDDCHNKILRGE